MPPRPSLHRWRRAGRIAPTLVVAWAAATFVAGNVSGLAEDDPVTTLLARSLVLGAIAGGAAAWLETGPLARAGRRLPLGAALAVRTLAYAALVAASMAAIIALVSVVQYGVRLRDLGALPEFQAVARGPALWTMFGLLVLASFGINLGLQLRRVLGPETLFALLVGRYRRPVWEERAFVFLDLTGSTAWAERLGPLRFTDLKNDFFADVAEPVLATGGRIVQYVGDEVMVSWPMRRAERDAAPLRFFFLVEAQIAARAERYRRRYGDVPAFKAGCHGGGVVTAEVGDLKRDIVHSGDVVNTAARIEGECRPRGRRLLVSAALLARLPPTDGLAVEPLGDVALRGKAERVAICAVTQTAVARPPRPAAAA